jgi:Tol biopolymer transport system component
MKLGRRLTVALAAGAAALTVMTTVPAGAATLTLPKNGDLVFVQFGGLVVVPGQTPAPYTTAIEGERPRFSPDGRQVAFVRPVQVHPPNVQDVIYVRTLATGVEHQVYVNPFVAGRRAVDWSPDGSKLVLSNGADLDLITVATGAKSTIWTAPAGTSLDAPAWSPDGSRIAFSTGTAIKLVHPDGTNLRTLTSSPAGTRNNYPDWSPDSQKIAFVTNRFRGGALSELVTLPRSGAGVPFRVSYQAFPQGFFFLGVAWSPDGKKIAALQSNDTLPVDPDDQDERTKVRAYLPDGTYSYSLTGPIAGDDAYEGVDWGPKVS